MSAELRSRISIEDEKALELQAKLCQSLTHPFRLKLIQVLKNGQEKNVGQIENETRRPQPFISQHLRVLREKGIVKCERKKNEVYYSLTDDRILEICKLLADFAMKKANTSE